MAAQAPDLSGMGGGGARGKAASEAGSLCGCLPSALRGHEQSHLAAFFRPTWRRPVQNLYMYKDSRTQELPRKSQPDLISLEGERVGSFPTSQAGCWPLLLSCAGVGDLWLKIFSSAPTALGG